MSASVVAWMLGSVKSLVYLFVGCEHACKYLKSDVLIHVSVPNVYL
jgi:hypothetical protein